MKNPPMRSPRTKLAGLFHLGRMIDKMRLHVDGTLPDEYQPNLGLTHGLDGHLCGFLGVEFSAVHERVRQGGEDEEIAEWCFQNGLRPSKVQTRIWNEFARKFGWDDFASGFLAKVKEEDGVSERTDLVTSFDLIDYREGRRADRETGALKLDRLDHLVLTVRDVEASCAFYERVLWMKPVTFGDGRRALEFGRQKINLHPADAPVAPHALRPTAGSADLCFIATGSVAEFAAHLRQAGVAIVEGPVPRTGALGSITSIYFRDPDGNLIEVSEY